MAVANLSPLLLSRVVIFLQIASFWVWGCWGEAPCGCSSSAGVLGFAVLTAEMWVSGFCQCFPRAHQASVSLSKVSSEKIDQTHTVTPVWNSLGLPPDWCVMAEKPDALGPVPGGDRAGYGTAATTLCRCVPRGACALCSSAPEQRDPGKKGRESEAHGSFLLKQIFVSLFLEYLPCTGSNW